MTGKQKVTRSTTQIGDELRDHVIDLLEAEGHTVSREIRIGTKKIDILVEMEDEFRPKKIAIECKNLSKNLSQEDLNHIWADYMSLWEQGKIAELYVITRLDSSPEAKSYAGDKPGRLDIFSIKEFEEKLLGFRKYCREVRDLFNEGGLDQYYVKSAIEAGGELHERIMAWASDASKTPVAILGGYGMGKTSYCKFLTRELADRYIDDPLSRVPIYVRLSDIATQSDVDGLIAKTLAGRYQTKNYSFAKFKKLNRAGRFVIIFDGFDEMKHALSWADFKYNFAQIHSLLEGRAKIIVAGRPNAFLSDSEHAWILRGQRLAGEQVIRIPGAPEYTELPLALFSDDEVTLFLQKYLRQHHPTDIVDQAEADRWVADRVKDFDKLRSNGDLYRPVHLKIYADIAADPDVKLESFTTYNLYSIAATRISEREGEKVVRKQIDSEKRQRIIEHIAWWLWDSFDGRRLYFIADTVPDYIIGRDLLDDALYERESLYREIFTGSFLERKFGQNYHFSHRSFLEFFVARRLERAEKLDIPVASIFKNINPEILAFLRQSPGYGEFLKYVDHGMQRFSGEIPQLMMEEIYNFRQERGLADVQLPIQILIQYYGFLRQDTLDIPAIVKAIEADLSSKNQEHREAALYFALFLLRVRYDRAVMVGLLQTLAKSVKWPNRTYTSAGERMSKYSFSRQNIGEYVFVKFSRIAAEMARDGQLLVSFDYAKAFDEVRDKRSPKIVISEDAYLKSSGATPSARIEWAEIFDEIGTRDQNVARDVLAVGVI
ncbi:NACHT domain-containing protein [Rhizobium sp. GCM10022189]|uniref:NACHT domain-containing protein n=1 Tax=Rhizobium sp. GCM10022189 TaxID=3252654 RepID=UPI003619A6F4